MIEDTVKPRDSCDNHTRGFLLLQMLVYFDFGDAGVFVGGAVGDVADLDVHAVGVDVAAELDPLFVHQVTERDDS